jgi:hypothetical protein
MFRDSAGRFRDDDPADPFAHHVVARVAGAPIATLRIVPLAATRTGVCERLLGAELLDTVLARIGASAEQTWEGSGWAVQPGRRGAAMGPRVVAAGWAVARELGLQTGIGAVGRRYGQLYRVLSVGYRRAEDVEPKKLDSLADEVQLVHGSYRDLRPGFHTLVEQAADLLEWTTQSPTRANRMTS